MELLLLDKNFKISGLIDDFSSLVWNRKYYDCGSFSLQTNIRNLKQFKNARYIYSKEFQEIGILETFDIKNTTQDIEILQGGRFLESILSRRVVNTSQKFKDMLTEDIIRSLINTFAISDGVRKIEKLVLGDKKGLGVIQTIHFTGKNLLTRIYELCKEDEFSIHVNYDFNDDKLVFETWQGLDRTDIQNNNSWAIFSRNFENILEDEYSKDETQYCNFAYVAGETNEETGIRTVITIDRVKDDEERRELYVDARDLQKEEGMADETYLKTLIKRGNEKLSENNRVETVNFKINPLSNLIYKKDFNLGDKVVYKNDDLGLVIENRIIEISEVYENGDKTIDVTFGDDYNIKKIREVI